jgi:hypothetical protein
MAGGAIVTSSSSINHLRVVSQARALILRVIQIVVSKKRRTAPGGHD